MSIAKRTFRNKLFLFGFIIISGLLLASILYFIIYHDRIPTAPLLFDNNGKPIPAPYSGILYPPFGTDNFGRNIAIVMLIGAKYTIFAAFAITLIRVVPSIFFGFLIHFYLGKFKKPIKYIADSINYFPVTLFAFLILNWISFESILMQEGIYSFWELVLIYILVLSVFFIPFNSVLIANEVQLISKMEFIECSRTLGASTWHIISKHIRTFLVPKLYLILIKEFMQSLILMAHLGVLKVFIGGITFKEDLFGISRPVSPSSEWAGTLGMWWSFLWTSYPWISLIPIILLTVLILAAKCILDGLQNVLLTVERVAKTVDEDLNVKFKNLSAFQLLKNKKNSE
ncbi:peptide ABC transporter permease [Psychrobacillus sp. PGGUH221]|uniref:ABC transporter permease n=1 Tax=Psychrobacillus sp. PGGUH221 TaxID=3020058 RepID=UPI0035C66E02